LPEINLAGKFVGNLFSLKLPTLECIVGNRPHITSLLNLARIPTILFIALLGLKKFIAKRDRKNVEKVCEFDIYKYMYYNIETDFDNGQVVGVMFIFLEGTYFSVVQDVVSTFGCTIYDKGFDLWFVNTYPWIQCNPMTGEYAKMISAAIPGLLYMILYPSFLWFIVKRARRLKKIQRKSKQEDLEKTDLV
jgi:hypothetical protein